MSNLQNKLDKFIKKWEGKILEAYDPSNFGECYDLITAWANYIGLPAPMTLYAYQIYDQAPIGWTRKQNMSNTKPQAGDIVVWAKGYAGGVAGHTAVATGKGVAEGKDSDWFEAFSQNDPLGTPCQLKKYNFNYVRGWLRPDIDLEVSQPNMNNDLQKKASGFDRIWHAFSFNNIAPEKAEEKDHLEFIDWVKDNVKRAGKWDKLVLKAGEKDSSKITEEELYEIIYKKGESLNSSLAEKVLKLEQERDTLLNSLKQAEEDLAKADGLRECRKEKELTWGDLIIRVWQKIKGVKV